MFAIIIDILNEASKRGNAYLFASNIWYENPFCDENFLRMQVFVKNTAHDTVAVNTHAISTAHMISDKIDNIYSSD